MRGVLVRRVGAELSARRHRAETRLHRRTHDACTPPDAPLALSIACPPTRPTLPRLPLPCPCVLQPGDLAIVDFSASRVDTGEELLGASRSSMRLDTDDADTTFLPGIVAIMGGMRPGEERVAPLTFPTDGVWLGGRVCVWQARCSCVRWVGGWVRVPSKHTLNRRACLRATCRDVPARPAAGRGGERADKDDGAFLVRPARGMCVCVGGAGAGGLGDGRRGRGTWGWG